MIHGMLLVYFAPVSHHFSHENRPNVPGQALALSIFQRLQRSHLLPDAVCCSAAVGACERGARWHRAVALLAQLATVTGVGEEGRRAVIRAVERGGPDLGREHWVKRKNMGKNNMGNIWDVFEWCRGCLNEITQRFSWNGMGWWVFVPLRAGSNNNMMCGTWLGCGS